MTTDIYEIVGDTIEHTPETEARADRIAGILRKGDVVRITFHLKDRSEVQEDLPVTVTSRTLRMRQHGDYETYPCFCGEVAGTPRIVNELVRRGMPVLFEAGHVRGIEFFSLEAAEDYGEYE